MTLATLLPKVQTLPRADKYHLMQMLVADLATEEGVPLLRPDVEYRVDSPYDAFEAAETLQQLLDAHKEGSASANQSDNFHVAQACENSDNTGKSDSASR